MTLRRALLGSALSAFALTGLPQMAVAQNLGTFETSTEGWGAWASSANGASTTLSRRDGHAVVQGSGSKPWHVQLIRNFDVAEQTTYEVSFDAWAASARKIEVRMRGNGAPSEFAWRPYGVESVPLTTERKRHTVLLSVPNTFNSSATDTGQVVFLLGNGQATETYFDNIDVTPVGAGKDRASGALNLVAPGTFDEDGVQGFYLYADHAKTRGTFTVEKGELEANFTDGGEQDWHIQMLRNAKLKPNTQYDLQFYAVADAARSLNVELLDADEYLQYDFKTVDVPAGESLQTLTLTTGAINPGDGRLAFRLGGSNVGVAVDDIRLTDPNQLYANGDFDSGTDGWSAYSSTGNVGISTDTASDLDGNALAVKLSGGTGNWWDGGLYTDLNLASDSSYTLEFATDGRQARTVQVQVIDDSNTFIDQTVDVPAGVRNHSLDVSIGTLSGNARLFVFYGDSSTDFHLDGVSVTPSTVAPPPPPPPSEPPTTNPGELVPPSAFDERGYVHADSLIADQSRLDVDVRAAYSDWSAGYLKRPSQAYIDANGGGEMLFVTGFDQNFVGRPEKGAVSEGVGYGLVITALMDDRDAFDKIWRFAETKLNEHGLMHWLYDDKGNTVNFNGGSGFVNATDGDLDAAYGLLVAAARWGGDYDGHARELIDNLLEHNVTDDNYLTSGDDGYDEATKRALLNRPLVTSYMAPGYFRLFADFTGNTRWDAIADQGLQQIRNNQADVRAQGGGAGQDGDGLITFRMLESGKIDWTPGGNIYHSDGARAPWRIMTDYAWFGSSQARDFSQDFNGFARRQGINNLYESYNEKGERVGGWGNTQAGWMSGPLASTLMISDNAGERNQGWDLLMGSYDGGYYSASCRMLGILFAGGWYQNPVVPD